MASIPPAPPPPPPPPPPAQQPPKVLDGSRRAPKNRQHVVGVRPTQSEERSPFANIHPETLQHAAAGLRKTQYREPLLSSGLPEQTLRRPDQLAPRRHWEDFAFDVPLDQYSAREPVYDANTGASQYVPIGLDVKHSHPINRSYSPVRQPSLPYSHQQQVNSSSSNINNKGGGAPSSTYSYSSYSSSSSASNNNNDFVHMSQLPMASSSMSNACPFRSKINNGGGVTNSSSSSYSMFYNNNNKSSPHVYGQQQQQSPSVYSQQQQQSPSVYSQQQQQLAFSRFPYNSAFQSGGGVNSIKNPQAHIREYATKTLASSIAPPPATAMQQESQPPFVSSTFKKTSSYNSNSLAKELRNSGLTDRQKYCNQFQKSLLPTNPGPAASTLHNLYQETQKYTGAVNDPLNHMDYKLRTNYGAGGAGADGDGSSSSTQKQTTTATSSTSSKSSINKDFCAKCGSQIVGDTPGVTALGNAYHVSCFACDVCQKQLAGCSFYSVDGKNLCQVDYMNSLEKCEKCLTPITQKILRAMGKPFHPECFACPVCAKSLDGIPFTVDKENLAYCLDCYHERFSPRCAVCLKAIAPSGNETEVARVIAMDRSYHIDCYRCEDCGLKLNSKVEGQGCYPLENHLLCKNCNLNRLKAVA